MAIETLDKGVCRAMGQASTSQAAPAVRGLGLVSADYTGLDGTVLITLERNFNPLNTIVLATAIGVPFGAAVPNIDALLAAPNQIRISTYDNAAPPVLAPGAVYFAIFELELAAVMQIGP